MVFAATKVMNMFPQKGGNSYYSPGMIMTGMGVLIEELRIKFGLYIQSTSSTMPHSSMEPWTRGAIALGSMGNATGGQVLLALDTRKLLRRSHVKVVTMTFEFIAQVNHLGSDKTSLLTFQNRRGEEIGEGNMLNCVNNGSNTGEDPDVVDNVTGVFQPYKEYVDKWNMGVPENWLKFKKVTVTSI